ncbi:MAG: hypothetical protein ACRD2G_13855, partial [Terriglobia bacterium]
MSVTTDFINELMAAGVRFAVHGDRLRVDGPAGVITAKLKQTLVER